MKVTRYARTRIAWLCFYDGEWYSEGHHDGLPREKDFTERKAALGKKAKIYKVWAHIYFKNEEGKIIGNSFDYDYYSWDEFLGRWESQDCETGSELVRLSQFDRMRYVKIDYTYTEERTYWKTFEIGDTKEEEERIIEEFLKNRSEEREFISNIRIREKED